MVITPNISGWWLLFFVAVYAVPVGVYLHERRWLTRLLAPLGHFFRVCPLYLLIASSLLVGKMTAIGSTKTNHVNSVEIELDGATGTIINENLNDGSGEPPTDSGSEGLSGVVPVRSFDPTQLCFTGIAVSTNGVDLCRSVDERLVGKTPSVALPMYNGYPMYGPSLVNHINTNCWAYGLDFSCASPWNTVYTSRLYPATAISRRHVILAAHLTPTDFQPLYGFRGTNNVFYTRSLVATNYIGNDIVVGLLDSELPAAVNPAKILPADAPDYIKSGRGVPVIALDQYERVYVTDMSALYEFRKDTGVGDVDGVSFSRPNNVTRKAFNKFPLQGGDSGDPCFAVISNNLVLLSHLSLADWFGPSYATLKSQIQAAMDALCTGYSLEEYDLSTYGELP